MDCPQTSCQTETHDSHRKLGRNYCSSWESGPGCQRHSTHKRTDRRNDSTRQLRPTSEHLWDTRRMTG